MHYPKLVTKAFQTDQVGHIMDIMPTCLDLAGAKYPKAYNDHVIKPVEGKSLLPILKGNSRKNHEFIAWEHFDSRAIRKDTWKLIWSRENKKWELYDLAHDRAEMNDLSTTHTGKVKELSFLYQNWSKRVGVSQ